MSILRQLGPERSLTGLQLILKLAYFGMVCALSKPAPFLLQTPKQLNYI